ncbi:uncharacterized protein BYT42DRAFT_550196 [Radiomyces spectabilis]|uniref:uncharacterized protein n=1 Tax=Radiomyces spectabilis TaxID=64574 RepID=UPI00221F62DA|nr:uncharacterized protein BYT42DRAFT_550196 [Radiomyces spectabilis]KAI8365331.1 hypothetical protein BYT42DRAFT_550196 [Radiomyces spectabilis]
MSDLASSYLILWASQTGNAEWIAKNIHSEAQKRGYTGECFVMDEWEKSNLEKAGVLILVASNTGDGDPPDNAIKFWRFIRRQKQKDYLANTKVTLLGLGDTNYSNFNNTAKRLEKKVKELGATVFYPKGLADDAEGLESVVDPWIEKLWAELPKVLAKSDNATASSDNAVDDEPSVQAVTTGVQNLNVADRPYSMTARKNELLPEVAKYVDQPNSMVQQNESKVNDYSLSERHTTLPDPVKKYTDLPNSLVDTPAIAVGHKLPIDLSGLQPNVKLTAIPRLPAAVVQLIPTGEAETRPDHVPDFVATPSPLFDAPVTQVKCLSSQQAEKRTLHVELEVEDKIDFQPGDAIGILAPNNEELVQALLAKLSSPDQLNRLYKIEGDNLPSHLHKASSVTLGELLRYGVDLTSTPRKALLRVLAEYATDDHDKTALMYICSKQGVAQFNALRDLSPTLLDFLTTFPSCQPPVARLLDVLPPHMPRYYSVANSPLKHQGKVQVAFNIVDYKIGEIGRKGVATPWLDRLTGHVPFDSGKTVVLTEPRPTVPIFMKHNTNAFVLPSDTKRPLVLIGPGTGVAPFIGFLEHRQEQCRIRQSMGGVTSHPSRDIRREFGDIWMYYGFRDQTKDYLFKDELEAFVSNGTVNRYRFAESRKIPGQKTYVQDLLREDSSLLYDFIVNKDAAIYVCGDAKGMAKGVHEAFVDMLKQEQNLDTLEANKLLMEWMNTRKYLRDLWA